MDCFYLGLFIMSQDKRNPPKFKQRDDRGRRMYPSDLRYRKHRKLTQKDYDCLEDRYKHLINHDFDTLDARINECVKTGGKTIDLSHLDLTNFPSNIPLTVENMFVEGNMLTRLPSLSQFTRLKVLDLSSNQLSILPTLPRLTELMIRNNRFKKIGTLPASLERFDCSHNRITDIKPGVLNISVLECSYNQLSRLPLFNTLIKLSCQSNKLSAIPSYPRLENLDCKNNMIHVLPQLDNLKELLCDFNRLRTIHQFPRMRYLYCANNPHLKMIKYQPRLDELECDNRPIGIHREFKVVKIEKGKKKIRIRFSPVKSN